MALAASTGGLIVNADSMQVYRELRILTARPSPADEIAVPHRLFGVLAAADPCSVGRWLELVEPCLAEARDNGRPVFVVGGTGLYLKALTEGLAPVPAVPPAVRRAAAALCTELGPVGLHRRLAERDPESARALPPTDRQRLLRAWEVLEATGQPLAHWQRQPGTPPLVTDALILLLMPRRAKLYAAIDERFDGMMRAGAGDEIAALLALGLDPGLPAMKAVGVPELAAAHRGRLALEDAVALAKQASRRFAKRQVTWFRHQLPNARQLVRPLSAVRTACLARRLQG